MRGLLQRGLPLARAPGAGAAFLGCFVVMSSRPAADTAQLRRNYGTRCLATHRAKFSSQAVPTAQSSGFLAPPTLARPEGAFLLMTDIDGTLCGDDAALRELNEYWLSEHVTKRKSLLGYSTGRELPSYLKLVEQVSSRGIQIMRPDILITCDGTQIWWFVDGSDEPQPDLQWAERLSAGWDRGVVRGAFRHSLDLSHQGEDVGAGEHGYTLDAREKPAEHEPYRFSCAVRTEEQARTAVEQISAELSIHREGGKDLDVHVFYNAGGPRGGFWVAALPTAGGKGNALKYVLEQLGMEPSQAVCCGDSGNDSPMFDFHTVGVRGIVVENAFHDLRSFCEAVKVDGEPVHFFASKPAAGGIKEGLLRMFA